MRLRNKSFRRQNREKTLTIFLFLLIPVTMLLTFAYYPLIKLIQMSFSNWVGYGKMDFIGFTNYIDVFNDETIWASLLNTFAYFIAMLVQISLGLFFAIILETKIRGANFFKSVIFMPNIMNGVAIAFMFSFLFNYKGPLNMILKAVGLNPIHWISANYGVNFTLASIGVWQFTGWCMVIFIAGLKSISKELYEAAAVDGANFFQIIKYIIIPSLKPVIQLNLFFGINGALQAYFQPLILTNGGPCGRSETFVFKTLDYAFEYGQYGKAAAMSIIMIGLVLTVMAFQHFILREEKN
ncbi:carbohydrate ABC transporter permease [Vallitalea guaymasensis]|uniref:carbohydrate ABC transporter permease n=1 Tax=Vallitalea guaymasensis TaxID=1185412 RepID=UPI00272C1192|nr:sugar ABC transporter permease [Vallitalea guaymasensis]